MVIPSFIFYGIKITEPGSVISDATLAFFSFVFFRETSNISFEKNHNYRSFFFLFISLSAMAGSFAHGLFLYTGKTLHLISWILSGIAIFYIELSCFNNFEHLKKKKLFIGFIKLKALFFLIICTISLKFYFVKINIAFGLLGIVFPSMFIQYLRFGFKSYLLVMLGILLAILPAVFHRFQTDYSGFFNMNDMSHFFLVICLLFIFSGFKSEILKLKPVENNA
ncbi:MAG: hypothetical protein U0W24_18735 [Bacteroidales bacterium]